ncbi:MAG: RluA family pseudouridine synthase [Pseudomonadota bacterium]
MHRYAPPFGPLRILEANESWVIVDKPPGLLSVPGRGREKADCLEARLRNDFGEIYTVHRLDMETSGVMVFARTPPVQSSLSKAFQERRVEKTYEALVQGVVEQDAGDVDLPLVTDWPNRPRQKVCQKDGKSSQTHWAVIERLPELTRIRLTPHTGRSHQLRVHMMAIGHPIVGDSLYSPRHVHAASPRLMLHACVLKVLDRDGRALASASSHPAF